MEANPKLRKSPCDSDELLVDRYGNQAVLTRPAKRSTSASHNYGYRTCDMPEGLAQNHFLWYEYHLPIGSQVSIEILILILWSGLVSKNYVPSYLRPIPSGEIRGERNEKWVVIAEPISGN